MSYCYSLNPECLAKPKCWKFDTRIMALGQESIYGQRLVEWSWLLGHAFEGSTGTLVPLLYAFQSLQCEQSPLPGAPTLTWCDATGPKQENQVSRIDTSEVKKSDKPFFLLSNYVIYLVTAIPGWQVIYLLF